MRPLYKNGDAVVVFDTRAGRWVQGCVISATLGRALVQTAKWWGFIPADPRMMRKWAVLVGIA